MSTVPNRETFESMYAGKAPWDIGKPQPAFVEVADRVTGAILDAGCGTGENALFFAGRGHLVLGIDFLERPIEEARRKSQERGLNAEFLRMDALTLTELDRQFDSVIDSGLFHVFSDEDRPRYVAGLAHVTRAGRAGLRVVLQRRGARHARPEAGLPEGASGIVCGWLGYRGDPTGASGGPHRPGGPLV